MIGVRFVEAVTLVDSVDPMNESDREAEYCYAFGSTRVRTGVLDSLFNNEHEYSDPYITYVLI